MSLRRLARPPCQEQGERYDEAEEHAQRAVAIQETLDLSAEPWTTYGILAKIAEARGRTDEALDWRRKEQESFAACPDVDYQLPEWAPGFVRAVVGAVQGVTAAHKEVDETLPQMEAVDDWQGLATATRRILDGDRDADALCRGDNRVSAFIIRAILDTLAGNPPERMAAVLASGRPETDSEPEEQGMSLDDILSMVAFARTPDPPKGLTRQLRGLTEHLANDPNAPDEIHALARVLSAILDGDANPDLSGLPDPLAVKVRALLVQ